MNKQAIDFIKTSTEILEMIQSVGGEVKNKDALTATISTRLAVAYNDGIIEGMDRAGEIFRST